MGARQLTRWPAVVLLLCGIGCAGPRPRVSDVRVTAAPEPGRYRVQAIVRNESRGEGQVSLDIRLHDIASGRVIAQQRLVPLRGHEQVALVADIEAPASTYRAEVRAQYPPQ